MGAVERLLLVGQLAVLRFLEGDDYGVGFAFVAQIGQGAQLATDGAEGVEQARMGA
jgi:hypothetical protein